MYGHLIHDHCRSETRDSFERHCPAFSYRICSLSEHPLGLQVSRQDVCSRMRTVETTMPNVMLIDDRDSIPCTGLKYRIPSFPDSFERGDRHRAEDCRLRRPVF
jgi:hypothetical protein